MRSFTTSLIAAAAVTAAAGLAPAPASAADMRLMTGPQGGVWIPLGGQLKDMWEKAIPGLSVTSMPGAGIANVRGIEEGKTEVGFGTSISTVDGVLGNAPFTKPHKKVCNLASLYPQYFQVIVPANAGISSIKDLKGKTVAAQPRGNTAEIITQHILKVNGLSYNEVKPSFISYTDAVEQMKDGNVQAFTLGTTIPSGAVMDLASARDIKLLDLSDSLEAMKKINPGYTLVTVPKGTYPKQDQDVKVIGYATHIVASCELPEDRVYAMVKAMADNVSSMAATNKAMEGLTPQAMAEDIGVPFHPGAAKFYKEKNIAVKTM
ncbi:MAG: TAXI family TRAP transporter solute-binding subunit [Microvirga sp.]